MKTILLIGAAAAGLALAGCAGGGYYGYGPGYAAGYDYVGPSDVWYDGYYGPYSDGYWDTGGVFFYRDSGGHYRRDSGGHFRSQSFSGSQHYQATPHHRDGRRDRDSGR